jgi:hypothetical protein
MAEEPKFAVVDLGNPDPEKAVWIKFPTKEQAEEWAKNYNDNQRSTRQRKFAIKHVDELVATAESK